MYPRHPHRTANTLCSLCFYVHNFSLLFYSFYCDVRLAAAAPEVVSFDALRKLRVWKLGRQVLMLHPNQGLNSREAMNASSSWGVWASAWIERTSSASNVGNMACCHMQRPHRANARCLEACRFVQLVHGG